MQKAYWKEHSGDATVEAMMLDSQAKDIDKLERPEVGATPWWSVHCLLGAAGPRAGQQRWAGMLPRLAVLPWLLQASLCWVSSVSQWWESGPGCCTCKNRAGGRQRRGQPSRASAVRGSCLSCLMAWLGWSIATTRRKPAMQVLSTSQAAAAPRPHSCWALKAAQTLGANLASSPDCQHPRSCLPACRC